MVKGELGEGSSSLSAKRKKGNGAVRITSVQLETSGKAIKIVAGGFSFSIPLEKAQSLMSIAESARLNDVAGKEVLSQCKAGAEDNKADVWQGLVQGKSEGAEEVLSFFKSLCAAGYEFDEEDEFFIALKRLSDEASAEEKALRLCAQAEQYSMGLRAKLVAAGYSNECAKAVVALMEERGFVDDTRYAVAWAGERARRGGASPAAVAAALRARGVGEGAIREALSSTDFGRALARALQKELASVIGSSPRGSSPPQSCSPEDPRAKPLSSRQKDQIYRKLKLQGFDPDEIRKLLDEE